MKNFVGLCLLVTSGCSFGFGDKPYNAAYDPFRDPFIDYESAKRDALAGRKLVLIEIGGDWCIWCMHLEKFINTNDDLQHQLNDVFIVLKVNVSEEKSNLEFTRRFPKITGYPHFIITDGKGQVLGAQDTGKLETGEGYSKAKMIDFIARWKLRNH